MEGRSAPRVTMPRVSPEDLRFERELRPSAFAEFVGQDTIKDNLRVFIEAAKKRGEPLDHCLFYGPPGLGKTTLAHIIATEMETDLVATSGPVLERAYDLTGILTNLKRGDILFIDEIHRLQHNGGFFTRSARGRFGDAGSFPPVTDVRTQTEYGTLRSYFAFGVNALNDPGGARDSGRRRPSTSRWNAPSSSSPASRSAARIPSSRSITAQPTASCNVRLRRFVRPVRPERVCLYLAVRQWPVGNLLG